MQFELDLSSHQRFYSLIEFKGYDQDVIWIIH
jgi:hypothetical protein